MTHLIQPDFSNINVDRSLPTISITAILGMLEEPFDQRGVAEKTHNKHFDNPDSEYYQMSVEQIISKWTAKGKESCHYGSMLDNYIGLNLYNKDIELRMFKLDNNYDNDKRLHGLCDSFDNFYAILKKSGDTVFVDRERTVYYDIEITNPITNKKEKYNIKGRYDALFYNKRTNKWIIIDWKSSGSIDKVPSKWTKKLLGPMNKFPALNYYTYTTQLYFYTKTLIEKGYLPECTTPDDVVIMIVNLPGKIIEECGRNFMTHQAAYAYDSELLDQLFKFGAQKDCMNKQIEATKKKDNEQDNEQNEVQENISNQEDNLEELF